MKHFDWKQYNINYSYCFTKENAILHFKKYGQFQGLTDQEDYKKYKITVITPCSRPENLLKIKDSLNFDYINEWIIVYDNLNLKKNFESEKVSEYNLKGGGIVGNAQRNYGLTLVKNKESYIYFLDDDNLIHPGLYTISLLPDKIYTFDQIDKHDLLRLPGTHIRVSRIDTSMFLVYYPMIQNLKWEVNRYDADGYFICELYNKNKDKWIYINKNLCYYNKI